MTVIFWIQVDRGEPHPIARREYLHLERAWDLRDHPAGEPPPSGRTPASSGFWIEGHTDISGMYHPEVHGWVVTREPENARSSRG